MEMCENVGAVKRMSVEYPTIPATLAVIFPPNGLEKADPLSATVRLFDR
jgi:hypothetical protein